MEIKQSIKNWLEEEEISHSDITEQEELFHFTLNDVGELKMNIEIYQTKDHPDITIGFMTFLSKDLIFNVYKFSQEQKESFKRKVDDFLSSLRVDYRIGIRVGYEIISERGHYGAKYFIKTGRENFDKEKFLSILDRIKDTGKKADEFLNQTLKE